MAKSTSKAQRSNTKVADPKAAARTNPFDVRSNNKTRHPALNRKIIGGNRNVGRARTETQTKRRSEVMAKLEARRTASEIMDKRLDKSQGGSSLTQEERMLLRLKRVRENKRQKRADRFNLGEEEDDDTSDAEETVLTHKGRSLADVLDEEGIQEESDDDEDVEALVERLKSGEKFNDIVSQPKKHLTKKEAMLDVIRKSKTLKLERQREKAEDEEERDRLDALMQQVVTSGQLSFQPTGKEKELQRIQAARTETDDYERAVRELQLDRGPRAVATERVKTAEEIAAEELKELQELEAERLKRIEGSDDEDDVESEASKGRSKRKRLRRESEDISVDEDTKVPSDLPFVLDCPHSTVAFLELLSAFPDADLDTVISRIRKATSIHLRAENRARLAKFSSILVEHALLLGDRLGQLDRPDTSYLKASPKQIGIILVHLYNLATDVPRDVAGAFATHLETLRRSLDNEIAKAGRSSNAGGDLGTDLKVTAEVTRGSGGHKDGLAESLDADAIRLSTLRCDKDLFTSPAKCWPSSGHLTLITYAAKTYSVTDQRHPLVSSAALLLGRALMECPIRGSGDICAALVSAQCLEELIRRTDIGANRFAPELLTCLRAFAKQLAMPSLVSSRSNSGQSRSCMNVSSIMAHTEPLHAFEFARKVAQMDEEKLALLSRSLTGAYSYGRSKNWDNRVGAAFIINFRSLIQQCLAALSGLNCADILLADLDEHLSKLKAFASLVPQVKKVVDDCRSGRKPLRLQDFQPEDKSVAPRFLVDSETVKRPGDEFKGLKRQIKRERKAVARDLRLDGEIMAETRATSKFGALQQARAERHKNFAELQNQQAAFSKAVKDGVAIKGAGVGGLSLKGRRMGKKLVE